MVGLRECTKEKVLIDGRYVDCWVERRMSFNDKGKMEYTENVLAVSLLRRKTRHPVQKMTADSLTTGR